MIPSDLVNAAHVSSSWGIFWKRWACFVNLLSFGTFVFLYLHHFLKLQRVESVLGRCSTLALVGHHI